MEKCPKCRGQFISKNGFLLVNYNGQNQLVCPPCYQYLNYNQMLLEKKEKRMKFLNYEEYPPSFKLGSPRSAQLVIQNAAVWEREFSLIYFVIA